MDSLPIPNLGPPPMPDEALPPWLAVKLVGRPAIEAIWAGCYWSGFATATLLFCAATCLILLARSRRP